MDFLNNIYTKISTSVTAGIQKTANGISDSAAAKVNDLFKGVETGAVAVITNGGTKIQPPATTANILAPSGGAASPVMGLGALAVIAVLVFLAFRK